MQLFTAVCWHVLHKALVTHKPLLTRLAWDRSLTRMYACVPFQLERVFKHMAANLAAKSPFIVVYSRVILKLADAFKLLITNFTGIWRFAGMHAHVIHKFADAFKLLVANCTRKQMSTSISIHLSISSRMRLITVIISIKLITCINSNMITQVHRLRSAIRCLYQSPTVIRKAVL